MRRTGYSDEFMCAGKKVIKGQKRAVTIAKRMHRRFGDIFDSYFCTSCHYYHVGTTLERHRHDEREW